MREEQVAKAKARPATFGQGQSTPSVAVTHCRISRVLSEIIASRAFHKKKVQMQKQDPVLGPQNQVLISCPKRWNRMRLRKFKASFDSAKTGTTLVTDFRDLKMLRFVVFFYEQF